MAVGQVGRAAVTGRFGEAALTKAQRLHNQDRIAQPDNPQGIVFAVAVALAPRPALRIHGQQILGSDAMAGGSDHGRLAAAAGGGITLGQKRPDQGLHAGGGFNEQGLAGIPVDLPAFEQARAQGHGVGRRPEAALERPEADFCQARACARVCAEKPSAGRGIQESSVGRIVRPGTMGQWPKRRADDGEAALGMKYSFFGPKAARRGRHRGTFGPGRICWPQAAPYCTRPWVRRMKAVSRLTCSSWRRIRR